jgi:hypothetical protein
MDSNKIKEIDKIFQLNFWGWGERFKRLVMVIEI